MTNEQFIETLLKGCQKETTGNVEQDQEAILQDLRDNYDAWDEPIDEEDEEEEIDFHNRTKNWFNIKEIKIIKQLTFS